MCIQFVEVDDGALCALLRFGWTVLKTYGLERASQLESQCCSCWVLLEGICNRVFIMLLSRRHVRWSTHMVFLFRWSDGNACMVHSIWIAELKLEAYN